MALVTRLLQYFGKKDKMSISYAFYAFKRHTECLRVERSVMPDIYGNGKSLDKNKIEHGLNYIG